MSARRQDSVHVGLVQINNSFSEQHYFPYSVGLLQAYVQRNAPDPSRYEFLLPVYSRMPVEACLERLADADVVGFSTYVWNARISLEVARRLKEDRPDRTIVFGGPHVPDRAEEFLRQHPFIDVACHGEGEHVFLEILEGEGSGSWEGIEGISYLDGDRFVFQPRGKRIKDLSHVPSPYLDGVFEGLIAANPGHQWLVLWETNRGCPFSCTFCDWGSATASKVYRFDMERLLEEVDWFADHEVEFIFCCDANFGILPRDIEISEYVASTKARRGYPRALSVQNTKNAMERAYKVQKILADSGLNKGVTLSLQSVDPETLKSIKRPNISSDAYQELQRRFTRDRIETYTDMILALPGETYDSFADGTSVCMDNGQHNRIQFNNLSILPNAQMGDPEYQKRYGMVTVETQIINIHGAVDEREGEIAETQQLVTETASMPREDWIRTRTYSWMASLLHFDKVLQIPLVILREVCDVSYRELIEVFTEVDAERFPVLGKVRDFFVWKARDIQGGGPEYCASDKWLRIWWPADEYVLIDLCMNAQLADFYREAEQALAAELERRGLAFPRQALRDAVALNEALLKVPFESEPVVLKLSYNVWDFWRRILSGEPVLLEKLPEGPTYRIDRSGATWPSWDDWCREVVWYGNKKGAYLYGQDQIEVERQLDGHF